MKSALKISFAVMALAGAALAIGCSSDDKDSASPPAMSEVTAKLDNPTGTVSATTAKGVADAFQEQEAAGVMGGTRKVQESADMSSQVCTNGGSAMASGNSSAVTYEFGDCCMSSGTESCCINGNMYMLIEGGGTYSTCVAYDNVTYACGSESMAINGSYCTGADGKMYYSVTYQGETYTVTGYYSNGTGELTITGANGTYTCSYTDGAGSCVDSSGAEFTF